MICQGEAEGPEVAEGTEVVEGTRPVVELAVVVEGVEPVTVVPLGCTLLAVVVVVDLSRF